MEPLSEDAKAILAFVREHPGLQDREIARIFRHFGGRLTWALGDLYDRRLVELKMEIKEGDEFSNEVRGYIARIFPKY